MVMEGVPSNDELARLGTAVSEDRVGELIRKYAKAYQSKGPSG